ncbi:MAG: hypothetical protein KC636_31340 [Myxococcales bacterium]|nr:hypothetical protein [Myxococcales bacterium]
MACERTSAVILGIALTLAPAVATARADEDLSLQSSLNTPIEVVVLRADSVDAAALERALASRAPGVAIYRFGDDAAPALTGDAPGRRVFIDVAVAPADAAEPGYRLIFILTDGRAYERDVGEEGGVRAIASAIANTLAAIEDDAIRPARKQATIPEPTPAAPAPTPEPEPAPEPAPAEPAPVEPAPVEPAPTPLLDLGFDLAPVTALVLAPGRLQGSAGYGGALRLTARLPRGAGFAIGARTLARSSDGLWLVRTRVSAAAGYILRVNAVELVTIAGASVEPWSVREGGERITLGAGPLLGGFVSAAFGYRLRPRRREGLALRIGARLELGGSALPSGRAAEVRRPDELRPTLGLGGFELAVGIDVALWFTLRRARPR